MLNRITLRSRIFVTIICLISIVLTGGGIATWTLHRINGTLQSVLSANLNALQAAQKLQSAFSGQMVAFLLNTQKSEDQWKDQVKRFTDDLEEWIETVRKNSKNDEQYRVINTIESKYLRYQLSLDRQVKDEPKSLFQNNLGEQPEITGFYVEINDLFERYSHENRKQIQTVLKNVATQVHSLSTVVLVSISLCLFLGSILCYILTKQVLDPIRNLASTTVPGLSRPFFDEVSALSSRVNALMEDVDQTQTELRLSREHLLQSEKLALVGKLAAGVAHSIRNPLTSVKMRLFSMERSIDLSEAQRDDFDVISDEIRHIDTIVQNFLEFSRPPKLKIQNISPSDVVDSAIQLLRHRIESYGVRVEMYRQRRLPNVKGDPEQLKEVLVNLMVNACEAMSDGGIITITEEEGVSEPMGHVAVIKVADNGPGIPENLRDQVFQPFFSTKGEGTGLGLSIAARIVQDHEGCLTLRSRSGKGATFVMTLPAFKEDGVWLRS